MQDHTAGDDTLVKELQQFVKNEVAPYKYPREIEFVDDLPKQIQVKFVVELRDAEIEKWENKKITIKSIVKQSNAYGMMIRTGLLVYL